MPANATLSRLGEWVPSAPHCASTAREEMHLSKWVFRVQQAVALKPVPASGDNSLHPQFIFHLQLINAAYCVGETTQDAQSFRPRIQEVQETCACKCTGRRSAAQTECDVTDCICCPRGAVHRGRHKGDHGLILWFSTPPTLANLKTLQAELFITR